MAWYGTPASGTGASLLLSRLVRVTPAVRASTSASSKKVS